QTTGLFSSQSDDTPLPVVIPENVQSNNSVSNSGDCKVQTRVNRVGAMLSQTDCLGNTTLYTPDSNGMYTSVTSPEGRVVQKTFDEKQRTTSLLDRNGLQSFSYDPIWGKLASITDTLNFTTSMTYNALGLIETTTDEQGNVT